MTPPTGSLPLAAASRRLRGRPGRPHKPRAGHILGTAGADSGVQGGTEGGALAVTATAPVAPRLLDLPTAAAYLSCSPWTIRDLAAAGVLSRVRVPLPNGGELRKLLFDRLDLDDLISRWKEGPAA